MIFAKLILNSAKTSTPKKVLERAELYVESQVLQTQLQMKML